MRQLARLLDRFRRNEGGVAAVEFALVVPFLLALYFGSMEASALFTADKRVNSISATIGDLIAQWDPDDGSIPSSTLSDYFAAAQGIITPYSSAGLKQVVSLVYVKSDGTTQVLWSKAYGSGASAHSINTAYADLSSSSEMNSISRGGCVIAAETSYSYKPLLGQIFTSALTLAHTNYFIPRFGATAIIEPDSVTLAATACGAS